jgi:Protein of unknown function (DUF3892)
MSDIQITCVSKMLRDHAYEGITHVGNCNGKWVTAQVIAWIESGTHTFYTNVASKRSDVRVVIGPNGKYLRTYADDIWNDNLLVLPECP